MCLSYSGSLSYFMQVTKIDIFHLEDANYRKFFKKKQLIERITQNFRDEPFDKLMERGKSRAHKLIWIG